MRAHLSTALALSCLTACATKGTGPSASAPPRDPLGEVREAATRRDLARLRQLEAQATDAKVGAELGRALYWTGGVAEAKAQLSATCADARLPAESRDRSGACAMLAFDALSLGQPLNRLVTGGQGSFLDRQKLFIAMVSVGGFPAEPFIVDTGAPMTVISKRYADRVKLPYREDLAARSSDAAGNVVRLHPTVLGTVKWGEIEIKVVPAYVLELPENFKVGGILSPQDILRGTAFEFDGPARAVRTVEGAWLEHTREAPLRWNGGNFFVETQAATLPPLSFLLDSGAGANGVCEEALRQHGVRLDGGAEASSATAAGSVRVRTGIDAPFSVAGEPSRIDSLFVTRCPVGEGDAVMKSGYVGAPWFWSRRVFFPVDRRSVFFTDVSP